MTTESDLRKRKLELEIQLLERQLEQASSPDPKKPNIGFNPYSSKE